MPAERAIVRALFTLEPRSGRPSGVVLRRRVQMLTRHKQAGGNLVVRDRCRPFNGNDFNSGPGAVQYGAALGAGQIGQIIRDKVVVIESADRTNVLNLVRELCGMNENPC